jgi:nucleotide-binding universal stress UspA family protein
MAGQRLLIGYDGSPDARRAIRVAADTTRPAQAFVVTVWDTLRPGATAAPPGAAFAALSASDEPVPDPEHAAVATAKEGAALARDAGLAPDFDARHGSGVRGVADALIDAADAWGADLIVVGRRDVSRLHELVLGSVSDLVVRHSERPVLVVPVAGDKP